VWGQCRKITSAKANRKKSHAAATTANVAVKTIWERRSCVIAKRYLGPKRPQ
jgi:hypothetical protein